LHKAWIFKSQQKDKPIVTAISIKSFYEKVVPLGIPYFIFYPVFFNIILAAYRLLLFCEVFEDTNSPVNQFLNTQLLSLMPIVFIFLHHQFKNVVFPSVKDIFENETNNDAPQLINDILEKTIRHTFSINQWSSIYIFGITFLGFSTVCALGISTINNLVVKVIVVGILSVLIFFGSHLGYMMLSLLNFLRKIADYYPRESFPFYRLPHPSINRLQNYYLSAALMLTVAWIVFAIATWNSPYGIINNDDEKIKSVMILWLIITGSGPLLMFLWTYFYIHKINYNIKQLYIKEVSTSIQGMLKEIRDGQKNFESLKNYLELQDKIQNIKEWPINLANISTFVVTLGTFLGTLSKKEVTTLIEHLWQTGKLLGS
jgi:hypothetical protein